jgi:hypothetical protein
LVQKTGLTRSPAYQGGHLGGEAAALHKQHGIDQRRTLERPVLAAQDRLGTMARIFHRFWPRRPTELA